MIKPDYCSYCNSNNLYFDEKKKVFNPDTDEEEILPAWTCLDCDTVHVENENFKFFQFDIATNKELQEVSNNVGSWLTK